MSEEKDLGGRPRIEIDMAELDKLCTLQATIEEMASWFDCSIDTVERRIKEHSGKGFAEYFALKRGKGKISLRRKQFETAMSGNVTMQIFLGKNYLGQSDKQEIDHKVSEIKISGDDGDL